MTNRQPTQVTQETPIGPDVDLDTEDIRLADGTRLTPEVAEQIVEDVRRATGRPSLTGRREHSPEVSARVPPELLAAAKRRAEQAGISLSMLLREALRWYLEHLAAGGRPSIDTPDSRRGTRRADGR